MTGRRSRSRLSTVAAFSTLLLLRLPSSESFTYPASPVAPLISRTDNDQESTNFLSASSATALFHSKGPQHHDRWQKNNHHAEVNRKLKKQHLRRNQGTIGGSVQTDSSQNHQWLYKATLNLLDLEQYPLGSLGKGKWHELSSMLVSWSKYINSDASWASTPIFTNPTEMPMLVESILKRLIDECEAGNRDVQMSIEMYNVVLEAWLAAITYDGESRYQNDPLKADGETCLMASDRSLEILKHMQSKYEMDVNMYGDSESFVRPNYFSFLTVLKMFTRACNMTAISPHKGKDTLSHRASNKAHQTLLWMDFLTRKGRNDVKANVLCYTLVMDAYAKSGEKDAGNKAEKLMRSMQELNDPTMKPNLFCYNLVINAYTRQGQRAGAVDNAERILHELEDIYETTGDETMKPDVFSYTSLVTSWANSHRRGYGATRAEEIMNRMIEVGTPPNTVTYNAVLKSWCKSGDRKAPKRALDIFKRMEHEHRSGNKRVKPDRISLNTLIHTLAKSGDAHALNHAETLLAQMEAQRGKSNPMYVPNLFSYNTIIEGYSKLRDGGGAGKAYGVLRKLLESARNGSGVFPDKFSFNNVIFALSRSKVPNAPLLGEELLLFMEREVEAGNTSLQPDVFGYSAAIHAWAASAQSDAGSRGEALLKKMEEKATSGQTHLKPNTITYNSVIDCWAKSGQGVLGARKSERLVRQMTDMYEAGDISVKPTAHTYNSLLMAWANSNTKCAYWRCQRLLEHMWLEYEEGNHDLKPTEFAYNTVINAMSKSHRDDKAQQALRILRRMDNLYRAGENKEARPSTYSYTSVLNSCAFSNNDQEVKRKALDTAIFTFEELQGSPYGSPNHVSYGMYLRAISNLIPTDDERRRDVVEPVFLQCCEDGQVGEIVLQQLRFAAPDDLYQKLLGKVAKSKSPSKIRLKDIPHEWKCNVRNEKWDGRHGNKGVNNNRRF